MTHDEVIKRADKIIVDNLTGDDRKLERSDSFIDDLGADSLDLVELTMDFETAFGIEISDETAEKFVTVGDVHDYLIQQQS